MQWRKKEIDRFVKPFCWPRAPIIVNLSKGGINHTGRAYEGVATTNLDMMGPVWFLLRQFIIHLFTTQMGMWHIPARQLGHWQEIGNSHPEPVIQPTSQPRFHKKKANKIK